MSLDDGFIVTLEGHHPTITEQLRLLPFSQNILCLPPLELPPTPPVREKLNPEDGLPPLDPAVRQFILSLHHAHVARLARAKAFLADRRGERMVFLNGGFAAAQVACLETLRTALMSEENGNLENASREAEWVFEDIMQGGVQGLLDQEELDQREWERNQEQGSAYGMVEIGHIPSDAESVSGRGRMVERELYPHQLEMTPEPTPENTPKIPEERSPSPQKEKARERLRARVVSGPRNPTLEEIAAGVEICKASVAVRVGNRCNAGTPVSKYSPPPSPPPVVRTEFLLGQYGSAGPPRKRSEDMPKEDSGKPKGSRRKDRENNYILPPIESGHSIEIPTPPSSAKVILENANATQFPAFSDEYQSPELPRTGSCASERPSSPTPSSTADISGATILPSPRYLSGGFGAPPQFFKEPVDPLFPSVGEHLVIYFPSPDTQKSPNPQFLEKVLGDFAASFTPQTPGYFRSNPQALLMKRNSEAQKTYLSPLSTNFNCNTHGRDSFQSMTSSIATNATPPWPPRSSLQSTHHPDPPLSSIPTITTTAEKSPADLQNELRAVMRIHFPPASCPSVSISKDKYSEDDDDEGMRWLLEDSEIDRIWRPILSRAPDDPAYSTVDLIVAIGAEEDGENTESCVGIELRRRLVEHIEGIARKKGSAWNCGGRVGLKHLLSSSLPKMRTQHPGTRDSTVLKGHFLLPELEHHLAQNPHTRVLVVEFDFYTGSSAILELQRILGPDVNVVKVAAIADGVTQISSKPVKSKSPKAGGIRIRTSVGATTISYSLGPNTPTTPTSPAGALRIPRKPTPGKQQTWIPKQRLISRADMLVPPFSTVSSGMFVDAVEAVGMALRVRERMNGSYGREENEIPATPRIVKRMEEGRFEDKRRDTSYYLEEEETDEEDSSEMRASFRKRVKNGSKALKWLGLE